MAHDSSLYQPALILFERSASLRAVKDMDDNRFARALRVLEEIAEELGIPVAIVGGLAAIHHGALVTTVDIDIVVGSGDGAAFLSAAQQHGLLLKRQSARGWHGLVYQDAEGAVDIHVVPEGEKSPRDPVDAPPTPSPLQLGVLKGVAYASFAGWVMLKLVANRDKDRYHLNEALKGATPAQIAEAVQCLRALPPAYLREFNRLLRAAEDERQDAW